VIEVGLSSALNLGPPPANADEEESPIFEELRGFALEGVADELKNPSQDEQQQCENPQTVEEDAGEEDYERRKNQGDAERVTGAVYRVLMTGGVPCNPLLRCASAKHGGHNTTILSGQLGEFPRQIKG
jgi:hypothetical protein